MVVIMTHFYQNLTYFLNTDLAVGYIIGLIVFLLLEYRPKIFGPHRMPSLFYNLKLLFWPSSVALLRLAAIALLWILQPYALTNVYFEEALLYLPQGTEGAFFGFRFFFLMAGIVWTVKTAYVSLRILVGGLEVAAYYSSSVDLSVPAQITVSSDKSRSSVAVGVYVDGDFESNGQATCVAVESRREDGIADEFITATHVVTDLDLSNLVIWRAGVALRVQSVLQPDPNGLHDIAILRVRHGASRLGVRPADLGLFPQTTGTASLHCVQREVIAKTVGSVTPGSTRYSNYAFTGNTKAGWSGAGLYDVTGRFIGMHTCFLGDTSKMVNGGYNLVPIMDHVLRYKPLNKNCASCDSKLTMLRIREGLMEDFVTVNPKSKDYGVCNECSGLEKKKGKNKKKRRTGGTWGWLDEKILSGKAKIRKVPWGLGEWLYEVETEDGTVETLTEDEAVNRLSKAACRKLGIFKSDRPTDEDEYQEERNDFHDYMDRERFDPWAHLERQKNQKNLSDSKKSSQSQQEAGKGSPTIKPLPRPSAPVALPSLDEARRAVEENEEVVRQVSVVIRALAEAQLRARRAWEADESEDHWKAILQLSVDTHALQNFLADVKDSNQDITKLWNQISQGSEIDVSLHKRVERRRTKTKEKPPPSPEILQMLGRADTVHASALTTLVNIPKRLRPTAGQENLSGDMIQYLGKYGVKIADDPFNTPEDSLNSVRAATGGPQQPEVSKPSTSTSQSESTRTTRSNSSQGKKKKKTSQDTSLKTSKTVEDSSNPQKLEIPKLLKPAFESILSINKEQQEQLNRQLQEIAPELLEEFSHFFGRFEDT
ncbi:hypothetical protein 1 [Beihai sobemo-like virus 13]|uniref:hypothetical protein 1 n=1 Tax=Beihai sobemo-like virus 13 TaxID=1922684 RepID=UPI00090B8C27|nr:hypothetical protein 1 [Beihai sobemo-like virus 13]APG75964.1 hypothetical protein 1 [Beihai sobemo-like virus 13]